MIALVAGLLAQAALLLLLAPLPAGLAAWIDTARFTSVGGGTATFGPARGVRMIGGVRRVYRDLGMGLRRQPDRPPWASMLGALAPLLALGAALTAGLLVPTVVRQAPLCGSGDLIVLVALLAVSRMGQMLIALESGDGLAVLRAGRDLAVSTLCEPILLLALLAIVALTHSTDLPDLVAGGGLAGPGHLAALLAAAGVALLDGRRLTSRSVVASGGFSLSRLDIGDVGGTGRDYAFLRWARLVRHLVILSVPAVVFIQVGGLPRDMDHTGHELLVILAGVAVYLAKVLLLEVALRFADRVAAVIRPVSDTEVLAVSLCCGLLGLVMGGIFHA